MTRKDEKVDPAVAALLGEGPPFDPTWGDEERATRQAGWWARRLMKNSAIAQVVDAMISFRRCYAVAYHELQELVQKEGDLVSPFTEDMLVQAAMHAAAAPFSEHNLMQGLSRVVLPWVAGVVDRHALYDREEELRRRRVEEEQRGARPVPVGFKFLDANSGQPQDLLVRERSLVLMGWANAVYFVLDQALNSVLAASAGQSFTVLRLADRAPGRTAEVPRLHRLPPDLWRGCCNVNGGLARLMKHYVEDHLTHPVDLLVCDDMGRAYTAGFSGRPDGANAGDAHKKFRGWCDRAHAGFLGALPLDDRAEPDLKLPELEQLRTFAQVRGVRLIEEAPNLEAGKWRVLIGYGMHHWDVDRDVLLGYGGSNLLLPG